ncbi:PH domain-containing protein [Echinicola shivajiensis]|uniref:PH domain-containing protein n=1 Tax=Echinicola shivajiensis TaxID=1035916 RepID=UPI001BFC9E17|nr:PH domain-containing protein [Echinicola shivajiensis]
MLGSKPQYQEMKTFKSKFGYEMIVLLTLPFALITGYLVYKEAPTEAIILLSGIITVIFVFCIYLNCSTSYVITESGILKVKCGFIINKWYDIDKIRSISKTNNLISSPAPSLDRIEIAYGKNGYLVISPKDKMGFSRELIKINPYIKSNLVKS